MSAFWTFTTLRVQDVPDYIHLLTAQARQLQCCPEPCKNNTYCSKCKNYIIHTNLLFQILLWNVKLNWKSTVLFLWGLFILLIKLVNTDTRIVQILTTDALTSSSLSDSGASPSTTYGLRSISNVYFCAEVNVHL